MKRISYFAMSTLTVLVLLFGYRTSTSSHAANSNIAAIAPVSGGTTSGAGSSTAGTPTASPTASASDSGAAASSGGATAPAAVPTAAAPATTPSSAPTSAAAAAKSVTGDVAQTRWGPVQLQLTVQSGKITDVSVVQYPNGNGRDQEINAQALPILINETLSAQNAHIDMVSGATVTSDGYLTSLQSALNKAGL